MKTIKFGSSGQDVEKWQDFLGIATQLVFTAATEPYGYFGHITDTATRKWQNEKQLKTDGVVGPITWKAAGFESESPAAPVYTPRPPTTPPPMRTPVEAYKSESASSLLSGLGTAAAAVGLGLIAYMLKGKRK